MLSRNTFAMPSLVIWTKNRPSLLFLKMGGFVITILQYSY